MRSFIGFLAVYYVVNFGMGYFTVRKHASEAAIFCHKVMDECRGWNLAAVLVAIPGEANACLDIGYYPMKGGQSP